MRSRTGKSPRVSSSSRMTVSERPTQHGQGQRDAAHAGGPDVGLEHFEEIAGANPDGGGRGLALDQLGQDVGRSGADRAGVPDEAGALYAIALDGEHHPNAVAAERVDVLAGRGRACQLAAEAGMAPALPDGI